MTAKLWAILLSFEAGIGPWLGDVAAVGKADAEEEEEEEEEGEEEEEQDRDCLETEKNLQSSDTSLILLQIGIVLVRFHALRASPKLSDNHVDTGRVSPRLTRSCTSHFFCGEYLAV